MHKNISSKTFLSFLEFDVPEYNYFAATHSNPILKNQIQNTLINSLKEY